MNKTFLALLGIVVLGMSACNPEEGIAPEVIEHLKTPCEGTIHSQFHERDAGWSLVVTCADKEKIKAKREKIMGKPKEIGIRTDGHDPLKFGN